MDVTGIKAAFEALISKRGIYKQLGVDRSTVATWKVYLKEGRNITLDKMVEMLEKGGAIEIQPPIYQLPD
jgi:hypothetical protein